MHGIHQEKLSHTAFNPQAHDKHLLDPIDRFSEILFGIIMVLSFTGSISVATAGHEEIRTMLFAAIGCNVAWGFVDAVMYIVSAIAQRRRDRLMLRAVAVAGSAEQVRQALLPALHPVLADALTNEHLEHLRDEMARRANDDVPASTIRRDLAAAAAVFGIVSLSTFPMVIPFVIFHDVGSAKSVSGVVALVLLFLAGGSLGKFSGSGILRTGGAMVLIGLVLVTITRAFGG